MAEKQMNIDDTQEEYLDTLVKLALQRLPTNSSRKELPNKASRKTTGSSLKEIAKSFRESSKLLPALYWFWASLRLSPLQMSNRSGSKSCRCLSVSMKDTSVSI